MRFCALICLSLLLLAFCCAPIHKHETGQDASCLFCHATTRAEWHPLANALNRPVQASAFLLDKYPRRTVVDDVELSVRIPRAPPSQSSSL